MPTVRSALARVRNHIVTGFIFIMPVLITLAVMSTFWKHLLKVGAVSARVLRVNTVLGPSGDAVMAALFFVLICIVAGFLVRVSFLRRVSERVDQQLDHVFPGYSKLRSETRKKIGADKREAEATSTFEACLVKVQHLWEPGYIIERNPDRTLTVFVPQAPATAQGQVYVAEPSQVRMLGVDSIALNSRLKHLGKDILTATGRAPLTVS
ncbi:MAG: hypothetical protein QM765_30590 [Myxococcales bacterium]